MLALHVSTSKSLITIILLLRIAIYIHAIRIIHVRVRVICLETPTVIMGEDCMLRLLMFVVYVTGM